MEAGRTRRPGVQALRIAVVLVLMAGWAGLELHAARERAMAQLANLAATAANRFEAFAGRFAAVSREFGSVAAGPHIRVRLAARMLRLEPALAPAQSLFLFDVAGRFIAATLPLLPGDADVSDRGWFRAAATGVTNGLRFSAATNGPLGQGAGVVVTRTIGNAAGAVVGVIGTFLDWPAVRALATPPGLPPGSVVRLAEVGGGAPMLAFAVGRAAPHPLLDKVIGWVGETPRVAESARLPGGLVWTVEANVFAGVTPAERRTVLLHGVAVVFGAVLLAWLLRPRRRRAKTAQRPADQVVPVTEIEWGWEIDSRGRLVGVAGNAPSALVAAVGTNFLDLLANDQRAEQLREAIAERVPVHDLVVAIVLPGSPSGVSRRFRVNGRFVADTGGFWGTAEEIPPVEPIREAAD